MPELNFVSTSAAADPTGAAGQQLQPYYFTSAPGYNYGGADNATGTGFMEFGSGTPGSLPFRVDQAGNVTAASITGAQFAGLKPSGDTSGATDLANINALIGIAGTVYLAPGTFYLNGQITPVTGTVLQGSGEGATIINQVSTTAHGIYANNVINVKLRDFTLAGPGSGSGDGIHFDTSSSAVANCEVSNVNVKSFGGYGVYGNTVITSRFAVVETQVNGLDGFHFTGGTSLSLQACYSNGDAANGYSLTNVSYAALTGCAVDNTANGYLISGGSNVTLTGCGAEAQTGAYCYKVNGAASTVLAGCYSNGNPGIAFWVTGSASRVVLIAPRELSPGGGATASIQVDAGSVAMAIGSLTTTATSLAANTTTLVTNTNIQPGASSGTSTVASDRTTTSASSSVAVNTAGVNRWAFQLRNDTTNDLYIQDLFQGLTLLKGQDRGTMLNLGLLSGSPSFGNGVGVIFIANDNADPNANPTGGGILYVSSGALKYRGSSGTVTTIAPA